MSFEISDEQKAVITALKNFNVQVDSVAGSGKTTTIIEICKAFPEKDILLLTYNRNLRLETQGRIEKNDFKNIQAHTYHSYLTLKQEISKQKIVNGIEFDIFIIDEAQDMNILFYETFLTILKQNKKKDFKICIFGEKNQEIYQIKQSDYRFLTLSDQIYQDLNNYKWKKLELKQSFRVTQQIADFMNICMLHEDRLVSKKQGDKPIYLHCNTFVEINKIYKKIIDLKINKNYNDEDFFILAPSIKSENNPPISRLAEMLSKNKIPIFYALEGEKVEKETIEKKMVFSTFHQVKGLERKVVFIFSFDSGYFDLYTQNSDHQKCTNDLYVAVSRASQQLVIIHHINQDPLYFLPQEKILQYVQVEGVEIKKKRNNSNKKDKKNNERQEKQNITVSDLIKNLSSNVIKECLSYLNKDIIQDCFKSISVDSNVQQKIQNQKNEDIYIQEYVESITGTAIPIYLEIKINNEPRAFDFCLKHVQKQLSYDEKNKSFQDLEAIFKQLQEIIKKFQNKQIDSSDILYISNLYNCIRSNLFYKFNQVKEYNWLKQNDLKNIFEKFREIVKSDDLKFEKQLDIPVDADKFKSISGCIDCIDETKKIILELKFTNELKDEHIIQLGLYMYMFAIEKSEKFDVFKIKQLFDELQELSFDSKVEHIYEDHDHQIWDLSIKKVKMNNDEIKEINSINQQKIKDIVQEIKEILKNSNEILQKYQFLLFNLKTNEICKIKSDMFNLSKFVNLLLSSKQQTTNEEDDNIFIQKIHQNETYKETRKILNEIQDQKSKSNLLVESQNESSQTNKQQLNKMMQQDSNQIQSVDNNNNNNNNNISQNQDHKQIVQQQIDGKVGKLINSFQSLNQDEKQKFIAAFKLINTQLYGIDYNNMESMQKQDYCKKVQDLIKIYSQLKNDDQLQFYTYLFQLLL